MAIEIERKFLLRNSDWRIAVQQRIRIAQAYLNDSHAVAIGTEHCSVRVRLFDQSANINIKSRELGAQRQEFEYAIPVTDAEQLLSLSCHAAIDKTRHILIVGSHTWEVDEFSGLNAGLIVAEIELDAVDETFERPDWLGLEVTDQMRYYNMALASRPYSVWSDEEKIC